MCGFPFAPIQILTGDIREGCHARHSRLHDVGRSLPPKSRIERRFESLPGVQRFANLWGTFGSFRTSEKNKTVPFREVRGFPNLDSAHPNIKYTLTKLKPSQREIRGSANLESAYPNNNFPLTKLNPFKESSPDKKHVSETNIRDVQKGEIHAIRAVLWEANRPKPFRCRFKVMLFRCHPWR